MTNEAIKEQVIQKIANGRVWSEARGQGQSKYRIDEKVIHVRYRSSPKSDGVTYAYNINPNTLSSDYELWICGNASIYYFIPISIIHEIYNDPGGYVDHTHPNLRVSDINTTNHNTLHSRLENSSKNLSPYFCAVMPPLQSFPQVDTRDKLPPNNSVENDTETADLLSKTPVALDLNEPTEPSRVLSSTYRILRDTEIARSVKTAHEFRCQVCGEIVYLKNNLLYAEAHHIKPLGLPHNGPDIAENILCVCPNHHVQLDYGAIKIEKSTLRAAISHQVGEQFIEYHNKIIFGDVAE